MHSCYCKCPCCKGHVLKMILLRTRMHSSRMRTVRCSGHLGGRGSVCLEGCLPGGCLPGRGVYTPLWTDRHLWKHNLSITTVADGNKFPKKHCQWRIQDFPDGWGANPKGGGTNLLLFWLFPPKSAGNWRKNWPGGGASLLALLDTPMMCQL